MKIFSRRNHLLLFFPVFIAVQLFSSSSLNAATETIINDPNGDFSLFTPDVVSVAASEPSDSGHRLLVWVDATTRNVFAQRLNADTNQPVGAMARIGDSSMAWPQLLPNGGESVDLSVDATFTPGQPIVVSRGGEDQWLVAWPARVTHKRGTTTLDTSINLIGRTIGVNENGELMPTAPRLLNARWRNGAGNPFFFRLRDDEDSHTYAIRYDELFDRYLLVWSGARFDAPSGFEISACLIDGGNGHPSHCPDEAVATFSPGGLSLNNFGGPLDFVFSDDGVTASLIYSNTGSSATTLDGRAVVFRRDVTALAPTGFAGVFGGELMQSPTMLRDTVRNEILLFGRPSPFPQVGAVSLKSVPISGFPSAMAGGIAFSPQANRSLEQPRVRYLPDEDVFLARWEEQGLVSSELYWGALDRDSGEKRSEQLEGFRVALSGGNERHGLFERSVLVQNNPAFLSVIGRSASRIEIVASRFSPHTTDLGVTVSAVGEPSLHGETAIFHVAVDNTVPEDGLLKLAVAHGGVVRLMFSHDALTPEIDDGVCSELIHDGTTWVCQLAASLAADDVLEFDVRVDTAALVDVPNEGATVTLTTEVSTTSNDPVAGNNRVAVDVVVMPIADLVLALADEDGGIGIVGGEDVTLSYRISNNGDGTATGVALNVALPEGLALGSTNGCMPNTTSGDVRCAGIADIIAGESATVTLTLSTSAVTEEITQLINASVETSTGELNMDNNVLPVNLSRVPVGEDPVDPTDPADPSGPAKSGGGGVFGFALLALLPALRRRATLNN